MSRPLRIGLADGWYHVKSCGLEHRDLLADDRDRRLFLNIARGRREAAPPSGALRPTDPARRAAEADGSDPRRDGVVEALNEKTWSALRTRT